MKKSKILGIALVILICSSVFYKILGNPIIFIHNWQLKKAIISIASNKITLNEVVPFEWDVVYSFPPYESKEDIEAVLGFSSNAIQETVNDNMVQLFFVKDKRIVSSICGYSNKLGYDMKFENKTGEFNKISFSEKKYFEVRHEKGVVKLTAHSKET